MIDNNVEKYIDNLLDLDDNDFIEFGDAVFDYLSLVPAEIYL